MVQIELGLGTRRTILPTCFAELVGGAVPVIV